MARTWPTAIVTATALLLLAACSSPTGESHRFTIYATTGYLADAATVVAPDAEVVTMVGPGGDPHTYQPSTRDIQRLRSADAVLWNGLQLEAQMERQLRSLGATQLAVAERLDPEDLLGWPGSGELYDPHVWNDPQLWSIVVGHLADHLAARDPENAAAYRSNAERYVTEITEAAERVEAALAAIPPQDRILVTGHDAFAYYGRAFDLEVHATDAISTEAQLSASELSALADLITTHQVPVIFHDNQANPQAITSLQEAVRARGWEVTISPDELYADTLGAEPGTDSYLGVLDHNTTAIVQALGGQ